MKYLMLSAALACPVVCGAQKAPIKFGDVPAEALDMKTYEPDSSAEAVVLVDYGVSTISYNQNSGFKLEYERVRRIKVLTEAGKQWADFVVSLYKDSDQSEDLAFFKGVVVHSENGKVVESRLAKDAIFKERRSKNLDVVKVTLPNVKVGSVIDINYKIRSDFLFNFQDWDFQSTIPTVLSEYRASIPEYFYYEKYMQGYIGLAGNEQSSESVMLTPTETYRADKFRWIAQNVPAFKDEPYMTTRNDYISRLNFELATISIPGEPLRNVTGSWQEINERFAESSDFLGQVTGNAFLRKIAEEVTASASTEVQKIEAVFNYVRRSVAWNGETRISADNLKDVLENKRGNSAEINLLIATMLEKVNINVRPVLLSTRDHGFVREATPAALQFNYSVCQARWEDKMVLLDGTNPFLPIGYLPARCLNGRGMAVAKTGFEWVALNAPAKTRS